MSATAFTIVLVAAALHAGWNVLVKGSRDTLMTAVLIALSAAAIAAVLIPFVPLPARASWPFLLTSTALQIAYFSMLAASYRAADMSLAYPVMRGTAPLLVALAGAAFGGQVLAPGGWLAIMVICAGILMLALPSRRGPAPSTRGLGLALATAAVIASYTLVDGAGVRRSGHAAAYTIWLNLLTGVPFAVWVLATRRAAFAAYLRGNWARGLIGGAGTMASYGLALWAMTQAPVALVAALRESSVVFGTALSVLVLGEKVSARRLLAAGVILTGAIAIRLS